MNPSADVTSDRGLIVHRPGGSVAGAYLVPAAMPLYSALTYAASGGQGSGIVAVLASTIAFFLTMYVYFGVARLTFEHRYRLLALGGAAGIAASCLLTGLTDPALSLGGWIMLLAAGIVTGILTRRRYRQGQVYMIGAIVVAGLFTLQSAALWAEFLASAPEMADNLLSQLQQMLIGQGYGSDAVNESIEQSRQAFGIVIRLFPALTIMGSLTQFSVGYGFFLWWVCRRDPSQRCLPPLYWKVPFGMSVVVMAAILVRLLGGDFLQTIGDNILAILATYYCVAGLALIEYFLRKLRVSKLMKILFYLLLFLTQLMGFIVVALAGFVDSFADWRRVQLQKGL